MAVWEDNFLYSSLVHAHCTILSTGKVTSQSFLRCVYHSLVIDPGIVIYLLDDIPTTCEFEQSSELFNCQTLHSGMILQVPVKWLLIYCSNSHVVGMSSSKQMTIPGSITREWYTHLRNDWDVTLPIDKIVQCACTKELYKNCICSHVGGEIFMKEPANRCK